MRFLNTRENLALGGCADATGDLQRSDLQESIGLLLELVRFSGGYPQHTWINS